MVTTAYNWIALINWRQNNSFIHPTVTHCKAFNFPFSVTTLVVDLVVSAEIALGINVYASIELEVVECVELCLFDTGKSLLTFSGHQRTADRTFIMLHLP